MTEGKSPLCRRIFEKEKQDRILREQRIIWIKKACTNSSENSQPKTS